MTADTIETAVDATIDLAAELARVTAELATLKAGIEQLSNPMAVRVNIYRGNIAKPWPEPHEVWAQAADRAKQNEAEIERLKGIIADQARDESGRVSMPLAAHNKIDAARRERDAAVNQHRVGLDRIRDVTAQRDRARAALKQLLAEFDVQVGSSGLLNFVLRAPSSAALRACLDAVAEGGGT